MLEAAIHRDFEEMLAISEKKINHRAHMMVEEVRNSFPSRDGGTEPDMKTRLDSVLSGAPWLAHVFLFDENGFLFRSRSDRNLCKENEFLSKSFRAWFEVEAKMLVEGLHKKSLPFMYEGFEVRRAGGNVLITTALFTLPGLPKDRIVLAGVSFEPDYLRQSFFPAMLENLMTSKSKEEGGNGIASRTKWFCGCSSVLDAGRGSGFCRPSLSRRRHVPGGYTARRELGFSPQPLCRFRIEFRASNELAEVVSQHDIAAAVVELSEQEPPAVG